MTQKLTYTNELGESIEFSLSSLYRVNIPTQVTGLCSLSNTIYRAQVMERDGDVEAGYHVEALAISIQGKIYDMDQGNWQGERMALLGVLTPHQNGTLAYTVGTAVYTIAVRVETTSVKVKSQGDLQAFQVQLTAPDPYWQGEEIEYPVGTETQITYYGTMGCGIEVEIESLADGISLEEISLAFGGVAKAIAFRTGNSIDTGDVVIVSTQTDGILATINDEADLALIDLDNSDLSDTPLMLYKGVNTLTWAANGDEADLAVTVRYTPLYLGV